MKKSPLIFLAVVLSLIIFACQKEIATPLISTANCKACIYLPFCTNQILSYYDTTFASGVTTATLVTDTLSVLKDTSINNKSYQKIKHNDNMQNAVQYVNCENGTTSLLTYNGTAYNGATVPVLLWQALQANAGVGNGWVDTILYTGNTLIYKDTIKEKAVTRSVSGLNFNDVIHVQTLFGSLDPVLGFVPASVSDYYYARGVGLIEVKNFSVDRSILNYHQVLRIYYVP